MNILVLNCGSSSIKYQLFNMKDESVLADGIVERIGEDIALFTYKSPAYTKKKQEMVINNHERGLELVLNALQDSEHGVIGSLKEIDAVGHRLVHAGEHYSDAVVITPHVKQVLQDCIPLRLCTIQPISKGLRLSWPAFQRCLSVVCSITLSIKPCLHRLISIPCLWSFIQNIRYAATASMALRTSM